MGVVYIQLAIIATMIMVRAFFIALMLVSHVFPSPLAIPPPPPASWPRSCALFGAIPCCRPLVVSPKRRWSEEVEVDSGGVAAFFLVVVRLLSRRSGGGAKRWRWTAVGSPPLPLLSYACCPVRKDNKRTTTRFRVPSAIRHPAGKRCPHRFRREETPWAFLHLHLQTTPTLSTLNFHKEPNQCK